MLGFQECSWNVLGLLFNSNYCSLKQCICIWVQAGEEETVDMNLRYARWMSPVFEHTTAVAPCADPPCQLLWVGAGMEIMSVILILQVMH